MPTITDEMVNIFNLIGVNMKLKRIIAALFATALLLAPVSASESSLVCNFCHKQITWYSFSCGGIDSGYTEIKNCYEHQPGVCKKRTEYGYSNYSCSQGCDLNVGHHKCHVYHEKDDEIISTEVVCPYGDYPG